MFEREWLAPPTSTRIVWSEIAAPRHVSYFSCCCNQLTLPLHLSNTYSSCIDLVPSSMSSSKRKSKALSRLKDLFRPPITPEPLCSSCRQIDFWSGSDSSRTGEISIAFDYGEYVARHPKCPFCTLVLHRVPQFRMLGSESNTTIPLKLQIKGQQAYIWSDGRNLGSIRKVD